VWHGLPARVFTGKMPVPQVQQVVFQQAARTRSFFSTAPRTPHSARRGIVRQQVEFVGAPLDGPHRTSQNRGDVLDPAMS
jgi:hypothetical protein